MLLPRITAALCLALASASAWPQGNTIYKHIDANGRITYGNVPMKGAAPVELGPISIIPGIATPETPDVAKVEALPVSPKKVSKGRTTAKPIPAVEMRSTPTAANVAAPETAISGNFRITPQGQPNVTDPEQVASAPRANRLQQALADAEVALEQAQTLLTETNTKSEFYRGLRAVLPTINPSEMPAARKAELSAEIQSHFDRVREMEDTVAERERRLTLLRTQVGPVAAANTLH